MDKTDGLLRIFPDNLRQIFRQGQLSWDRVQEIRLRAGGPVFVVYDNREYCVTPEGRLSGDIRQARTASQEEIRGTVEAMGHYSLYAFEEEIRQGFITLSGGHRVGLAGKTVTDSQGIRTMKYISFLNVRLAHQVRGCADPVMPFLLEQGRMLQTLIISPPRCGKTPLLRDVIRQLPVQMKVGGADERSEIAACFQGVPQNDLGPRTDVLDCCPKARGMMMLIRTMSPAVIAVDEIGSQEDLSAMEYVTNCGCKLLATVHGASVDDIRKKPVLRKLMEMELFERYVVLDSRGAVGHISGIYDGTGKELLPCG